MATLRSDVRAMPVQREAAARAADQSITVRSLPKIVFLYPSFLAALGAGFTTHLAPEYARAAGLSFLAVLFLNMMVFSFDFPRTTSLTAFFFVSAVVAASAYVNETHRRFLPGLWRVTASLDPRANDHFYWMIAGGLASIFVVVLLFGIHFDYWQIDGNQVVHRHGLFHGSQQYSTRNLRVDIDIPDVFELLLLGSGRLIIHLPGEKPVVLENVRRIRARQRQLQPLLDRFNVEVVGHDPEHHNRIDG